MTTPRKEYGTSKVIALMSMSLDGYVADRNDGVAEVFTGISPLARLKSKWEDQTP